MCRLQSDCATIHNGWRPIDRPVFCEIVTDDSCTRDNGICGKEGPAPQKKNPENPRPQTAEGENPAQRRSLPISVNKFIYRRIRSRDLQKEIFVEKKREGKSRLLG